MPKRETFEDRLLRGQVETGKRIEKAMRALAHRDDRTVTQRELAQAVGVSDAAMSEWVTGKKPMTEETVWRVADYLGTTPGFLRYGVEVVQRAGIAQAKLLQGGQQNAAPGEEGGERKQG